LQKKYSTKIDVNFWRGENLPRTEKRKKHQSGLR